MQQEPQEKLSRIQKYGIYASLTLKNAQMTRRATRDASPGIRFLPTVNVKKENKDLHVVVASENESLGSLLLHI